MSRPDDSAIHEEYPPGLNFAHSSRHRAYSSTSPAGGYSPPERKGATPFSTYGKGGEGEYGGYQPSELNWGTNKNTPANGFGSFGQQFRGVSLPQRPPISSASPPPAQQTGALPPGFYPSAISPNGGAQYGERDTYLERQSSIYSPTGNNTPSAHGPSPSITANPTQILRSTLYWGDLEPWMDDEYTKSVCRLMKWNATVRIPEPTIGAQSLNPGYAYVTFPSPQDAQAAMVDAQTKPRMPNSSRPFMLKWASAVPAAPVNHNTGLPGLPSPNSQQFGKEYSIFVGDLAPETSNSDLVAVFRNPLLGLRNDREPRFIAPFASCKSAKIMMDPVTGVSRGYGFVRFTEESDQRRALIEMNGLYCLTRPMRISAATAKHKPAGDPISPPPVPPLPYRTQAPPVPLPPANNSSPPTAFSVSAHLAAPAATSPPPGSGTTSISPSASGATVGTSGSTATLVSSDDSITSALKVDDWKNNPQAQELLSQIGSHGDQLSSSDPYNTTVFVGGLSHLVPEETLRSFFEPFGEIHYVKVPAQKHCGFVQFVKKADAERAIEHMNGYSIGGSRIRLSWGRSHYKAQVAAQAAAMQKLEESAQRAAQAAAATSASPPPPPLTPVPAPQQKPAMVQITLEQYEAFQAKMKAEILEREEEPTQDRRQAPNTNAHWGQDHDSRIYMANASNDGVNVNPGEQMSFEQFEAQQRLASRQNSFSTFDPSMFGASAQRSGSFADGQRFSSAFGGAGLSASQHAPTNATGGNPNSRSSPTGYQFGVPSRPVTIKRPPSREKTSEIEDVGGMLAHLNMDQWKTPKQPTSEFSQKTSEFAKAVTPVSASP